MTDRRKSKRLEPQDLEGLEPPEWLLRHVAATEHRARRAVAVARVAIVAAIAAILITGATNLLAFRNYRTLAELERTDTASAREAAARQCARGNLNRAEQHAEYQHQLVVPDRLQDRLDAEPILAALLSSLAIDRQAALERVRRTLPILDCAPNLIGREATPETRERQKLFVRLYMDGKLDPTPEAADTIRGPDEKIEPGPGKIPGG